MKNFNVLDYIQEAKELEELYSNFINLCEEDHNTFNNIHFLRIVAKAKPFQREILKRYEIWYAVSKLIVRKFSDKYSEFEADYDIVKNYIKMDDKIHAKEYFINNFINAFDIQVNILHTIIPIISFKETNFKKLITADLVDSELSQAELLYKHEYYRAAGAVGGVALERFLKTLCEVNQITIAENDTIDPLATKIYKSEKIPEFDIILLKSIQHLASIRNKCDHPKEEPKQHEVRELLDKIKKITFLGL
ncbi:MAG: hypothetical protein O8C61_13665 [Candidatus Methanoperedens sp.]|nr:hypothetical protein [Candidatus Methanoperedens sp.]